MYATPRVFCLPSFGDQLAVLNCRVCMSLHQNKHSVMLVLEVFLVWCTRSCYLTHEFLRYILKPSCSGCYALSLGLLCRFWCCSCCAWPVCFLLLCMMWCRDVCSLLLLWYATNKDDPWQLFSTREFYRALQFFAQRWASSDRDFCNSMTGSLVQPKYVQSQLPPPSASG